MKTRLLLFVVLAFAALLPTGCADLHESQYLTPTAIRSSFANVQVQIANGRLRVILQGEHSLRDLRFLRATTSSYTTLKPLTLVDSVYLDSTPNQIEFDFTPAPQPPFNIDLSATLHGQVYTLRADYYGSRGLSF